MDDVGGSGGGPAEEVALPKATVNKFVNEIAGGLDMRLTSETRELLAEVCTEFVQMLSAEANDLCEADKKKTITPGHILRAMEKLGLERYQKDVQDDFARHKEDEKQHPKGKNGGWSSMKASGVTDEELQRQQQQLFEMARSGPAAAPPPAPPPPP
ncbi:hypothetical protein BU14_0328s0005 [Porphyra umbilicalis]|uniref:Transcription factor CBF/NF-Y/archaeal histone domain-containing protein n=1 Tax=Porphyra umbilicalis TaxID=2786 RepID=A0A1X6NZC8_PORUM|nr:hypothetical protein BU14_0328s0005 [Porphyra umbilicalis]|eukprot:OSX73753.1 hypothetical protein BU14_0328s0005 [Porphyra umbilicalis]